MERNKGENVLVESVRNQKSVSIQKLLTEEDELCVRKAAQCQTQEASLRTSVLVCMATRKESVCVCLFHCHLPPDTGGKAANGGKGENELEEKKNRGGGREKIIKRLSPDSFN